MSNLPALAVKDGRPIATSLAVASDFGKLHKNVIRDIKNLECSEKFSRLNFEPSEYFDSTGRKLPMYEITRDGFTFLVMGFTGAAAAQWKERYIEAFNRMEAMLSGMRPDEPSMPISVNHRADHMVSAARIFSAGMRTGVSAGFGHARAAAHANAAARKHTGVDLLAELGLPLIDLIPRQKINFGKLHTQGQRELGRDLEDWLYLPANRDRTILNSAEILSGAWGMEYSQANWSVLNLLEDFMRQLGWRGGKSGGVYHRHTVE